MRFGKGCIRLLVFTLITGVLLGAGCARNTPPAYKIGAVLPLSGPAATMGEIFRNAIQLAVDDINQQGGVGGTQLELRVEDGRGDPTTSASGFMKLQAEGVKVCITTMSPVALTLVPLAERHAVLLFADASHPQITGGSRLVFRHSNTAEQEASLLAGHATSSLNLRRLGLLWVNDEFGRAFTEALKSELQGSRTASVATTVPFEKQEADFRVVVQKVLASRPDGVIVVGYGKPLGIAIKRLREYKFAGPILTNLGFVLTPDALAAAGDAADGVYHNAFAIRPGDERYRTFVQAYQRRFGTEPPSFAVFEYNTVLLISRGLSKGGYDPGKIADAIRAEKTFQGAGESMSVSTTGDVLPEVTVVRQGRAR